MHTKKSRVKGSTTVYLCYVVIYNVQMYIDPCQLNMPSIADVYNIFLYVSDSDVTMFSLIVIFKRDDKDDGYYDLSLS